MKSFKTEKRTNKIVTVVKARQQTLKVVLENIHDPHNVSAIFRTCDAVGVEKVSLIYNNEPFPRIGKKSSASAFKWVEKEKFTTVDECYSNLRKEGFKIFASAIAPSAKNLYELDLTDKVAIVLGNEHRGVSEESASKADELFLIPMMGMVQSLNVSVATAVILYEALRQRSEKNMYDESSLAEEILKIKIEEWLNK
ncbi:MAG: RNA methyltransferase [Ignavibacteriales bacterium]|nr:MAG: RNA methyltransferase [Ignavibacteriales bacterium]